MNLLPGIVKELGIPYLHKATNLWIVEVKYHCYGTDGIQLRPYKTRELALMHGLKIGDEIYI